jgi:hypothetical protein
MRKTLMLLLLGGLITGTVATAQEHFTEGPVWGCGAYRTKPGQYSTYMKWLRAHYLVTSNEAKSQGLIVDSKVFVRSPANSGDWNVLICTLHESYAKALDYSAEDEAKWDAIQAAHWETADQDEQRSIAAKRFEMREFLGVRYQREVTLKPLE